MAEATDLNINRRVRSIMVKHWVDLGRISVRSNDGVVTVRGTLQKIAGTRDDMVPATLDAIFSDIKRLRDVSRTRVYLDNWINDAGSWRAIEKQDDPRRFEQQGRDASGARTFQFKAKKTNTD